MIYLLLVLFLIYVAVELGWGGSTKEDSPLKIRYQQRRLNSDLLAAALLLALLWFVFLGWAGTLRYDP